MLLKFNGKLMLPHKPLQVHSYSLKPLKQTELFHNAKSSAYPLNGQLGLHWDIDLPYTVERQSVAPDGNKRLNSPHTIVEDSFYRH